MKQRLDHWLWCARFFKSRSLASKVCRTRKVRLDGIPQTKASAGVTEGAVLTFPQGDKIRVIRVLALSDRRGPARDAVLLYDDLTPSAPPEKSEIKISHAKRTAGSGRPTKAERRAIDKLRPPD